MVRPFKTKLAKTKTKFGFSCYTMLLKTKTKFGFSYYTMLKKYWFLRLAMNTHVKILQLL